jgi:Family of unknown function (DUF6526)
MDHKPQSFAHHAKVDPAFHMFVLPVLGINVIAAVYHLFRFPGLGSAWFLIVSLALAALSLRTRAFATKLQDRIIRLEERLRLAAVLSEPLRSRIGELTDSQFVGLRFASDAELPALVQRALDEKLSRTEIKKAVTNWRADYSRV